MGRTRRSPGLVLLVVALAGCGGPSAPASSSSVAPVATPSTAITSLGGPSGVEDFEPPPVVVGVESPLGVAAPAVAEPAQAPDRSTPARFVGSLAGAIEARDLASLARLSLEVADKPALDANDLARAERDFLGPREIYWQRVLAGIAPGALEIDPQSRRVVVTSTVGGSLGSVELTFEKGEGGWLLR